MVLLTQNTDYTIEQISQRLDMSQRTIYRYLESFRDMGFIIAKHGNVYRLDKESPFFNKISSKIHFTEDEAMAISQVLHGVHENNSIIRSLRSKLSRLYDYRVLRECNVNEKLARNINTLYEAVKQERTVVLHQYHSTHSQSVTDRIIEPFLFLSGNSEVRGYEIKSGQNKTFKIARTESVEMLDIFWMNKERHKALHTDLFHFSGEETMPVRLRLSSLAATVLVEEQPEAADSLVPQPDGSSLLDIRVCSYKGIGRFVMGMGGEAEPVDSPDFVNYLKERAKDLTQKLGF